MSKVATEVPNDIVAWPWISPVTTSFRQVEDFQSAIRDEMTLFGVMQKGGSDWMARRQEALTTGLAALSMMSSAKEPNAAVAIWDRWVFGSARRINADITEAFGVFLKAAAATERLLMVTAANGAGIVQMLPATTSAQGPTENGRRSIALL